MLSYRHAFHAGNHGDVLKHIVLSRILTYIIQKSSPFIYLDTHAGAGRYDLNQGMACKTNDKVTGIEKIWQEHSLPPLLQPYFDVLHKLNSNQTLRLYPGSPLIAQHYMRRHDRAVCYELHPTDHKILAKTFATDRHFHIMKQDGFNELTSQLPPKERRGVILIDPSYEQTVEYDNVFKSIKMAMKKFPTGIYVVWYPLLQTAYATRLLRNLTKLNIPKTLHIELNISSINTGTGLIGSGVWIINPPYVLETELKVALPWLVERLGELGANWKINPSST